jgi:hypothetical protein
MNTLLNTQLINYAAQHTLENLGSVYLWTQPLMEMCSWETSGVMIQEMNVFDIVAEINSYNSTMTDWGGVLNKRYPNKSISIRLFIQGTSYNDLVSKIDTLKLKTSWDEIDFWISVWGTIRIYKATVESIRVPKITKLQDYVEDVEMSLLITSPLWSIPAVAETRLWLTSDIDLFMINEWTYTSFPVFYFIANTSCNITNISITIKKVWEVNGYTITIPTTFVNWDVIIADFVNKSIKKNWTDINFSWIMRPLFVGSNTINLDFTGTIAVDTTLVYNPTYL